MAIWLNDIFKSINLDIQKFKSYFKFYIKLRFRELFFSFPNSPPISPISNHTTTNNSFKINPIEDKHILNVQNYYYQEKDPYKSYISTIHFVKDKRTNKRYAGVYSFAILMYRS